ncbi:lipopolysaccharide biosynthesis protein [Eubacterium callanderi]|uniref:Polysaccharide biosynthesis protein n=1 Tax=Eubacterium limosum TaxID=1736 RepID=A0A6N3HGB1_EUBLI|nr:lipopolysaccharide biosynthesis protein [Eubacterium callanderi]MBO1700929.1 lipopolysaccharide biosynthesis protein [Eubacterium callanderi]
MGTITAESFIKKLAGFSMSTWINCAIGFIAIPLITRVYSTEAVGKINLFTVSLSLCYMIVYMGMDQAFVRYYYEPPDHCNKQQLFQVCLAFSMGLAVLAAFLILFFYKNVSALIVGEASFVISVCFSISLISNVFLRFSGLVYRMEQNTVLYTVQSVLVVFVSKLLYGFMGLINADYQFAIITMSTGFLVLMVVFCFFQRKTVFYTPFKINRTISKKMLVFGLPLIPVSLLSWLNNSLPQLLLKNFISYSAIGVYSNTANLASIVQLIQSGFNTYWAAFAYENYKTEKSKIQKVHNIITGLIVLFGLCVILFDDIIFFFVGNDFKAGKAFFPFLLITPICYTIAETTGLGINIAQKTYLNMITFFVNTLTNFVISILLMPKLGINGAAMGAASSAIIMLVLKSVLGEKYYRCITNYRKTVSAIIIISFAAICNFVFIDLFWLRYISVFMLIIIHILIYKSEIQNIIHVLLKIKKEK